MKKIRLTCFLVCGLLYASHAQKYDLELDLPEIPSSPAFIVMGVSPSEIESPRTPSDLVFSAQNASEDFTSIPRNYFLNIAPFWMFKKKYVSQDDFLNGKGDNMVNNIFQSLQVSLGVSDSFQNDVYDRRLGAGFSFSLVRGDVDEEIRKGYFDKLKTYNTEVNRLQTAAEKADAAIAALEVKIIEAGSRLSVLMNADSLTKAETREKEQLELELEKLNEAISERQKIVSEGIQDEYLEELKEKLKEVKFKRTGFFFNIAGGFAWDQGDNSWDYYRGGIWVNPGYQSKSVNWTGVGRLLSHNEVSFENEEGEPEVDDFTTIDLGLKLDYQLLGRASMSGELLFRSVPNTEIESSYRAVVNVAYNLSQDFQVNLTYGRDFDVFITGEPQYLALVNLVLGIGQTRKIDMN